MCCPMSLGRICALGSTPTALQTPHHREQIMRQALSDSCVSAVTQDYGQSPAEVQASLAVEQWVHCVVLPNITGQELCAGQHPYSNASISLQSGILLLQAFLGNTSAADAQ